MSAEQFLDWLALCEVDDFTPARDDIRAAVLSCWTRGVSMDKIPIEFPHTDVTDSRLDDESLDQHLAEIEEANRQLELQQNGDPTRAATDQDHGQCSGVVCDSEQCAGSA